MADYCFNGGDRIPSIGYNGSSYRIVYFQGQGYTLQTYTSSSSVSETNSYTVSTTSSSEVSKSSTSTVYDNKSTTVTNYKIIADHFNVIENRRGSVSSSYTTYYTEVYNSIIGMYTTKAGGIEAEDGAPVTVTKSATGTMPWNNNETTYYSTSTDSRFPGFTAGTTVTSSVYSATTSGSLSATSSNPMWGKYSSILNSRTSISTKAAEYTTVINSGTCNKVIMKTTTLNMPSGYFPDYFIYTYNLNYITSSSNYSGSTTTSISYIGSTTSETYTVTTSNTSSSSYTYSWVENITESTQYTETRTTSKSSSYTY